MKPFDGGMWVGVTRIDGPEALRGLRRVGRADDAPPGESVEDYDVFTRSLSIGPQTMVLRYDPGAHGHYRYQVDGGFPPPRARAGGRAS